MERGLLNGVNINNHYCTNKNAAAGPDPDYVDVEIRI